MLPKYLKVKGFRSYTDTTIDFTKFGDMFCVVGENGAGKSSIIEMITTALYWCNSCTDSKGAGMDECINSNYNYFSLEFCFTMNNVEYIIKTGKERGASRELEFYIDGIDQSEKVSETQQKINNVLKMNYDTFLDTVCIGQGASSRFMNKKPAERKQTLMQILDVQKFEEYEAKAKEYKKQIKDKIDSLQYKLDLLSEYDIDIDEVSLLISKSEKEISQLTQQINYEKQKYDDVIKEKTIYEEQQNRINETKRNFAITENQYKRIISSLNNFKEEKEGINYEENDYTEIISSLQERLEKKKQDIEELKSDISSKKEILAVIRNKLNDYKQQYKSFFNYNKAICELCGNEITEEHKQEHLSKLKNSIEKGEQKEEEIINIINKLNQQGKDLTIEGKEINQKLQEYKEHIIIQERKKEKLSSLTDSIVEYTQMLEEIKPQYESMKQLSTETIEEKTFKDRELKNYILTLEGEKQDKEKYIFSLEKKKQQYENNQKEIEKICSNIDKLKIEQADYTSIVTAFGKSGIPASIISHDIPEMEEETNKILKIISNDSLSIQYITTKSAKNKKTIDTLDIVVNDMNGSRTYETYSGGEKFRIDFACHIGMAKFLTKRSGASIDFLIIDEGLGSQDDFSKQKFIDSIMSLKPLFKQIMVITHIQDLQNSFDNKVFVQKNQLTGSFVESI